MKKIIISGILILFSINFIFAQKAKRDIVLEDIWKYNTFRASTVSEIRSMKDGLHYTALEAGRTGQLIVRYEYATGKPVDTLVNSSSLIPKIDIGDYEFSDDESEVLMSTDEEQIYRRSSKANYYILNRKSISVNEVIPVSKNGKQQYATFSPDGKSVCFMRENNLFVKNISDGSEKAITTDGKWNFVINGACDWVYEEEFEFARAFYWNKDGSKIAFYRFDESKVKEYSFVEYDSLYPTNYTYKYPKAGEANSKVEIYIYDLKTEKTKKVDTGTAEDQYIPRIKWTQDPSTLCVFRMNRHQNELELLLANAETGGTTLMMKETDKCFIDIGDDLTFLEDKTHFIWSSDSDGYRHLYLYNMNGKLENQITKGKWDISAFYGVDEKNHTLYYQSAEVSPMERHVYSIGLDGKSKKCLTNKKGQDHAQFSGNYKYFINFHSDANTPDFITLNTSTGEQVRVLEDNASLKGILEGINLSPKEFFSFKTDDGVTLNGWMIKPPDFKSDKKYPVFMTVYGGPGANTVNDSWGGRDYFWHQMLAEKGYIVVSVDNRGTGYRGAEFRKCTYKELGKLETIDQIATAMYLKRQKYIDGERIGIEGWSYGGYMTALCMTKGADYFKAGISVAPVTNWRFYDSIYTERYLITPQENSSGYDDNSPINFADKLKGKYLLVHGMADDNVHFQNSVEFVTALVKANKQFDSFFYPGKNHGIYGGNTRLHLYNLMTDFILKNL